MVLNVPTFVANLYFRSPSRVKDIFHSITDNNRHSCMHFEGEMILLLALQRKRADFLILVVLFIALLYM